MIFMRVTALLLCWLMPLFAHAQSADEPHYPKDYFRNPLNIPILLAGNFGECRTGHFHSGVDIKTQGKENLPVHAAGDGYISRIKTEKGGFGHAIYITHPNGYTTLYAHLNNFAPELQRHLRKQQYEKKRWDLDLSFAADKFPVKKGDLIAYSGNTGASSAPHLHFEIRDSKSEHPLNPQLFGLKVTDNTPPVATELVFYRGNVYDRDLVSYTLAKNGKTYKPTRSGNANYSIIADTIEVPEGMTGVGINADDYMEGSENTITFYTAKVALDEQLQCIVRMDDIGYDVSRYMHAYTDYYAKQVYKKWIQCLFRVPGNKLPAVYAAVNKNAGRLDLKGSEAHLLTVELTDNNGNTTLVSTYIKPKATAPVSKNENRCTPFYHERSNEFTGANISFTLDERELYDDICFTSEQIPDDLSDKFRLHYPYIPLHHYFDLMIRPNKSIPQSLKSKIVLMYSDGKDEDGKAAQPADKGWYKANVRNFGTYWLAIDTTAPNIVSMQRNGANMAKASQLAFTVKDAVTSVKTYSGMLDGEWICFEQHGSDFFYEFDQHCAKGKHELVFRAEDENGNEAVQVLNFSR
jgi:hypothetical protein